MEEMDYYDFDLLIESVGEKTYRARVLSSPAGQAVGEVTLPFNDLELENFLLKIGRTRRGVRRLESPEMEAVKIFGGKLFESVFDDELMIALRRSLEETRKSRQGLRIRLRLNDAPELVNLPWEFLYNPTLNRFLSLSVNTPIVRYLELPERINALTITPPLRMLVVISSPTDYPTLEVEREWINLKTALEGLEQAGMLVLDRLETASPMALQYKLRRNSYNIFHFIGHGGFDKRAQDGVLLFEDDNGRGRPLSGQYLGTLLHDEKNLRLALLNACEGGRSGINDPFAGVAQSLVQQGLPAVIAMQFEVTDKAAITFAREFYAAIADGYPADASLAEARKAIFSLGNDIEWGTPVLYMRAQDGRIFNIQQTPPTSAAAPVSETIREPQVADSQISPTDGTIKPPIKESQDTSAQPEQRDIKWLKWLLVIFAGLAVVIALGFGISYIARSFPSTVAKETETSTPTTSPEPDQEVIPPTLEPTVIDTIEVTLSPTELPSMIVDGIGVSMSLVPGDSFFMGGNAQIAVEECAKLCPSCDCIASQAEFQNEEPPHNVTLDPFYLDLYEVSNAQYQECDNAGICESPTTAGQNNYLNPEYADFPVVNVTWIDANAYCGWRKARLPTEAEWEKSARGTDNRLYPWGNVFDGSKLNFCDVNCTLEWANLSYDDGYAEIAPVNAYESGVSPYGIYNLAGNVSEWVADRYSSTFYILSPKANPVGPEYGDQRVVRGGSWRNGGDSGRTSRRFKFGQNDPGKDIGFRCALSANGE